MSESEKRSSSKCLFYLRNIATFLVSHIGLVSLVVGYCIMGAVTFEALEANHEREVKVKMVETRERVTDDLWSITNNMSVLYQDNWTVSVTDRLRKFEADLIEAMKKKGWDGSEDTNKIQWTFAGALFYSIILITTIGYGHIAPKTQWGKVVTIFYAILGIPLMLLCLANIGDAMAHSFRFLYWKVCCYACTRKPSKKSRLRRARTIRGASRHNRGSSRPNSLRRSQRHSQRSADSAMSDSAMSRSSYSASDIDSNRFYDDTDHEFEVTPPNSFRKDRASQHSNSRKSGKSTKTNETGYSSAAQSTSKGSDSAHTMESGFFNKYAMEEIEKPNETGKSKGPKTTDKNRNENGSKQSRNNGKSREKEVENPIDMEPEPIEHKDRINPHRSNRYSNRGRLNRLSEQEEEDYDDEEYYYDYDYSEDEVYESHHNKPVPIWLSILLVVGYIFGGAFLFSGWEEWSFLDSAYFCFITLTTIGFGDFVPAQNVKENVEISIALCSLYLLFGIALLAMSFNLVQEEVINSVKSVAKRLGIIKDEDGEEDD